MSAMQKQFKIAQLVAICVKKGMTPKKNGFCDFILNITASYWGFEKRTAKKYVDILIRSFQGDKWQYIVKDNLFLKEEEREEWMNIHL